MARGIFIKHLGSLRPADPDAEAFMNTLGLGEYVTVEAKRPRNIGHHRLFFAMLNLVLDNQTHYSSIDELLTALKFAIGHTDRVKTKSGEHEYPKSISFAKMDQQQFNDFFDRAATFLITEVIPGLGKDDLRREAESMIGMGRAA